MGTLSIIAGKWKNKKIHFDGANGLTKIRPTKVLVRKTLFDWIGNKIIDSYCLDAFAGSGILTFEALSREAKKVVVVDASRNAIFGIIKNLQIIRAEELTKCIVAKIPHQLKKLENFEIPPQFDIVFLDPPFDDCKYLIDCTISYLEDQKMLTDGALIYLELPKKIISDENYHVVAGKKSAADKLEHFASNIQQHFPSIQNWISKKIKTQGDTLHVLLCRNL